MARRVRERTVLMEAEQLMLRKRLIAESLAHKACHIMEKQTVRNMILFETDRGHSRTFRGHLQISLFLMSCFLFVSRGHSRTLRKLMPSGRSADIRGHWLIVAIQTVLNFLLAPVLLGPPMHKHTFATATLAFVTVSKTTARSSGPYLLSRLISQWCTRCAKLHRSSSS